MQRQLRIRASGAGIKNNKRLIKTVTAFLGDPASLQVEVIDYHEAESNANSYITRIDYATKAFQYACAALKHENANLNVDKLQAYVTTVLDPMYKHRIPRCKSVKSMQPILVEYLRRLQFYLSDELGLSLNSARKLISRAEEYYLWEQPRPILATVSLLRYSDSETGELFDRYIIQTDDPQPACDKNIAEQFLQATPDSNQQPLWYRRLPPESRVLYDYARTRFNSVEEVAGRTISSKFREIIGVANFAWRYCAVATEDRLLYKSGVRVRSSKAASRELLDESTELRDEFTVENYLHIIRQYLLQYVQSHIRSDASRNKFYKDGDFNQPNHQAIADYVFQQLAHMPILLQTLISPIPLPHSILPDRQLFLDKERAVDIIRKKGIEIEIEGKIYRMIPFNLFSTNHPLNSARRAGTGTIFEIGHTSDEVQKLIGYIKAYVRMKEGDLKNSKAPDSEKMKARQRWALLAAAMEEVERLLGTPSKTKTLENTLGLTRDSNRRELHLAAFQIFCVSRMGGLAYGSCVSGKDRKGLLEMYVDAMEIYLFLHHKLPKYDDVGSDRQNFVTIFAILFISGHQLVSAGMNAPGADGIKTPYIYLPKDIQDRICELAKNKEFLNISDRLASNNEFKHLLSDKELRPQLQKSYREQLAAYDPKQALILAQLPEDDANADANGESLETVCQKLIKIIDSEYWNNKADRGLLPAGTPTGVRRMRDEVLKDVLVDNGSFPPDFVISLLAQKVDERTDFVSESRSSDTVTLYCLIQGIDDNIDDPAQYEKFADLAELEKLIDDYERTHERRKSRSKRSNPDLLSTIHSGSFNSSSNLFSVAPPVEYDSAKCVKLLLEIIANNYWETQGQVIVPFLNIRTPITKTPTSISKMQAELPGLMHAADRDPSGVMKELRRLLPEEGERRNTTTQLYALIKVMEESLIDTKQYIESLLALERIVAGSEKADNRYSI